MAGPFDLTAPVTKMLAIGRWTEKGRDKATRCGLSAGRRLKHKNDEMVAVKIKNVYDELLKQSLTFLLLSLI